MRLVSYTRVSKVGGREGDSFQSPSQQRKAIDAIVSLTPGAEVVAEFDDLDESGGSMDRPGVKQAIAMVESGQADGIVVAYLDRWARTLEALELIESWAKEGKTFISARERFDAHTSQGKFALGMMLLVAKFYRDQVSERWVESCSNAIERGVHTAIPYGYQRGNSVGKAHKKGGTHGAPLVIEDQQAEIVKRIFAERIAGSGVSVIADGLNADGIPSPKGKLWTRQSVRALLRVRAYMGEARRGDQVNPDAHKPIISREDWEKAQTERTEPKRSNKSLLVGLVRCRGCGYVLGAGSSNHGGRRYNCNRHHAELDCPSPTTAGAESVESLVTDRFLERYGDLAMSGHQVDPALQSKIGESQQLLEASQEEFATWRDDAGLREVLGDADYRAGLLARKTAVGEAEKAYEEAMRQGKSSAISIDSDIWSRLDLAERQELLQSGIDAVVIGRAVSTHALLADRLEILWAGELEHDGSRSGIASAIRSLPD